MGNRCLITGSHGFVGQHLVKALINKGFEPLSFPRAWFTSPSLSEYISECAPDYLFHLAAAGNLPGHTTPEPDIFISNLEYGFNLLQAIKNIPLKGIINVSTSSVLLPRQITYAASKRGFEALCKAYVDQYDLPIVSLRPFSLYGEYDHNGHLIPTIIRSCLYGEAMKIAEQPVHDWVYVMDFVEIMIDYALLARDHKGKSIYVGSGNAISNWWLQTEIEEIIDKKANIIGEFPKRSYDTNDWVAKSSLGDVEFTKTSLREGLEKTIRSFKIQ